MQTLTTTINPARHESVLAENVARMSSREIARLTGKKHKDVIRDVRVMREALEKDGADLRHLEERKDARGYTAEFLLDRPLTETLLTGYSIALRHRVVVRLGELEQQAASRQAVTASGTKVVGEIAIMECFTRLLKPAPSCQVQMLAKIAQNNGLEPSFLPAYAVDAAPDAGDGGGSMPTSPLTALLKQHGIDCPAIHFNWKLRDAGIIKQMSRQNSKRETVHYWAITEKGLRYGKNLTSPHSPRETQPHWYVDRFAELASLVGKG